MTTTTVQRRLFMNSPFAFLETRRILHLAVRIEHGLERSESAVQEGKISSERHRTLVQDLRRRIDELSDASQVLMNSGG
ncbi:MAG: hypothetical protein ACYTAF_02240 [Planctomycetota bacterium]